VCPYSLQQAVDAEFLPGIPLIPGSAI